jgi:hypothetical protein
MIIVLLVVKPNRLFCNLLWTLNVHAAHFVACLIFPFQ